MTRPNPGLRSRWPYISLIPLGLGAWAPIYAGLRAQSRAWIGLGSLWTAISLVGWIAAAGTNGSSVAGLFLILGWVGGAATAFAIRSEYDNRMASPLLQATAKGERRLQDRRRALELARQNPELAREIGVGRPDQTGAVDAGLVDVNNAPVTALMELPGVTGDLATQIVETRATVDGFSTLEDFGATLDLAGDVVERLRGAVVFLPRTRSA
jgi:DNA uptake protein ComE-like DNA-binding protein